MSETSALLRDIRQRGLTQVDIGKRTGIPQPRLSKWEKGSVPAAADDALKLQKLRDELAANAAGVQPAASAPAVSVEGVSVDRRDPNRISPYAGTDIDRRAPAQG